MWTFDHVESNLPVIVFDQSCVIVELYVDMAEPSDFDQPVELPPDVVLSYLEYDIELFDVDESVS